jgi:hypothetical protein
MDILSPKFQGVIAIRQLQELARIWRGALTCGGTVEDFACLELMANSYRHCGSDAPEYEFPLLRLCYTIHWLRNLRDGSLFHVTDDRDRICGIFGMLTSPATRLYVETRADIKPQRFPIDYEKPVAAVYADIVRFLINTDRNLDCLLVFEDRSFRASDLPSWTIDWRKVMDRSFLAITPISNIGRACVWPCSSAD